MSIRNGAELRGTLPAGCAAERAGGTVRNADGTVKPAGAASGGLPIPSILVLLLLLLPFAPAVAEQPAPLTQGIPVIPTPSRPLRAPLPPGQAPSDAVIEQAKNTALEYLRCVAGGVLADSKSCEAYLHPDAAWPRSDPYAILLISPEISVIDVGVVPKTINLWNPDVEFVITVIVQADVIGRVSQLLEVKARTGTARRTIDLIMHNGQYRVIDMSRPMLRWAFPEAAAAWAGTMQGRSTRYGEVRTRIEALEGRDTGTRR